MTKFRVETVIDIPTGLIYAELYFPETNANPFVRTAPIYLSHEQAEQEIIKLLKEGLPGQPVKKSN